MKGIFESWCLLYMEKEQFNQINKLKLVQQENGLNLNMQANLVMNLNWFVFEKRRRKELI